MAVNFNYFDYNYTNTYKTDSLSDLSGGINLPIFSQLNFFDSKNVNNSFFDDIFMSVMSSYNSFLKNPSQYTPQKTFNTQTNLECLNKHYNPQLSNTLANIAYEHASKKNTRHLCLQGVREILNKKGLVSGRMGGSAYMAADVLAGNKNFKEVTVSRSELKDLPAGCVIVWDRNHVGTKSSDKHGHIAITTGNGGEVSDHVSKKIYMLNSSHRVFVPVGKIEKTA